MYSDIELEDIERRSNFYKMKDVAKLLLKAGVPRTKQAMLELFMLENPGSNTADSYDCLRNVVFVVHPQQINIRDKVNGKIIVSIPR